MQGSTASVKNSDEVLAPVEEPLTLANIFLRPQILDALNSFENTNFSTFEDTRCDGGSQTAFVTRSLWPGTKMLELHSSSYAPYSAPSLDSDASITSWSLNMAEFVKERDADFLRMPFFPSSHPMGSQLKEALNATGFVSTVLSSHKRAAWFRDEGEASPFAGRSAKEMRRQLKRLKDRGIQHIQSCPDERSVDKYIAAFFALEQSGWKGERGTALTSKNHTAAAGTVFLRACASSGKLVVDSLVGDTGPVSMLLSLKDERSLWTWKIAYDPAYEKLSPGKLLYGLSLEAFTNDLQIQFVDSLAVAGHPMAEKIFPHRIMIEDLLFARPGLSDDKLNNAARWLRLKADTKNALKTMVKTIIRNAKSR